MMHRNKSVDTHRFAMVPRAEIPRAKFRIEHTHKTTFDSGYLIPVYVDEVLPGDSFSVKMTAFARLSTPLFPVMDNCYLDSFFFFVPCRLVWDNWQKFMGEQIDPGDSTAYLIPQIDSPLGGHLPLTIYDYFGLPTAGQVASGGLTKSSALPFRAYNLIYNEWFRDQNLQDSLPVKRDDGPDDHVLYALHRRGKRHDYFTSCLPWPQKGESVKVPIGNTAPVFGYPNTSPTFRTSTSQGTTLGVDAATNVFTTINVASDPQQLYWDTPGLYADLAQATSATINQLRQSFAIQKMLERDARGGTRYTEIIRAHFGVQSPDARLQRPEYLGGGSTPIITNPVAQTSATGSETPLGTLAGMTTALANGNGFSQSFTEHGYIIGLVSVRADLTYQQGTRKMWSRRTRPDFYMPVFAHLGEQAVEQKEIYDSGDIIDGATVFGYQERWAEYRYHPSRISGLFKSTSSGTIDPWHLAQRFTYPPSLASTFIEERPPLDRTLAVGAAANGQQILFDSFFSSMVTRPMPLYSVPGQIDRF